MLSDTMALEVVASAAPEELGSVVLSGSVKKVLLVTPGSTEELETVASALETVLVA